MDELKKTVRGLTNRGRKAGREVDGHTVKDDIGNAGDDARMHIANARDEAKSKAERARDSEEARRRR